MSNSIYDRFNVHAQLEHLQSKYVGTGHADISKWQWGTTMRRDTLASHVGHFSRLMYFATCTGESIGRVRVRYIKDLMMPCGLPPPPDSLQLLASHSIHSDLA